MGAATGAEGVPAAATYRRDLSMRALLSTALFAYMGFILMVIAANAMWLMREDPSTHGSYLAALAANDELRGQVLFSLKLSLVTSVITTCIAVVVAVPSAYALSRFRFRGAAIIDTVIDLPLVVPPLVAGIALLLFFRQSPIGRLIDERVMPVVFTRTGIVVAQFFIASAFAIRAIKAAFDQVNPRFEFVARSLGCGPWKALFAITLPLARNGIIAGTVMTWARAMGEFAPVMMLAGSTPGKTDVLSVAAFLNMSSGHIEAAIAIVVLMICIAAVTLVAFKRLGGQGYIW